MAFLPALGQAGAAVAEVVGEASLGGAAVDTLWNYLRNIFPIAGGALADEAFHALRKVKDVPIEPADHKELKTNLKEVANGVIARDHRKAMRNFKRFIAKADEVYEVYRIGASRDIEPYSERGLAGPFMGTRAMRIMDARDQDIFDVYALLQEHQQDLVHEHGRLPHFSIKAYGGHPRVSVMSPYVSTTRRRRRNGRRNPHADNFESHGLDEPDII